MDDLRALSGTHVRISASPDGRVVATVHWDGVSTDGPIWWGSDEMCTLTPEETRARAAIAPVLAVCAERASPAPCAPASPSVDSAGAQAPSLWRRFLANLFNSGPARRYPYE